MDDLTSTTSTKGYVAQEVEGIGINQAIDFLLEEHTEERMEFDSREESIKFLYRNGYDPSAIEFMYWVPVHAPDEVMRLFWLNTGEKVEP